MADNLDQLLKLQAEVDRLYGKLAALDKAVDKGRLGFDAWNTAQAAVWTRIREGTSLVDKLSTSTLQNASANDKVAMSSRKVAEAASTTVTASAQAKSGMQNLGMSMLIVGQFADDLQYGLRGVVNNIPQLIMALGGGPGLAGVLSVVAVGANLAANALGNAFGNRPIREYRDNLDQLKARLSEIESKEVKTRIDFGDIDRLKEKIDAATKARDALAAAMGEQTSAEKESGGAARDALVNTAPGRQFIADVQKQMEDEELTKVSKEKKTGLDIASIMASDKYRNMLGSGRTDPLFQLELEQAKREAESAFAHSQSPDAGKLTFDEEKAAREQGRQAAGTLVGEAQHGLGAKQQAARAELERRADAMGQGDMSNALFRASPEYQAAQKQAEKDYDTTLKGAAERDRKEAAQAHDDVEEARRRVAKRRRDREEVEQLRQRDTIGRVGLRQQEAQDRDTQLNQFATEQAGGMPGAFAAQALANQADPAAVQAAISQQLQQLGFGADSNAIAMRVVQQVMEQLAEQYRQALASTLDTNAAMIQVQAAATQNMQAMSGQLLQQQQALNAILANQNGVRQTLLNRGR